MGNDAIRPELSRTALAGSFPGDLGITLTEITDERCVARMPVDRRHLHPGGFFHGGVWAGFADTVAAWGTMRVLGPGSSSRCTSGGARRCGRFACTGSATSGAWPISSARS